MQIYLDQMQPVEVVALPPEFVAQADADVKVRKRRSRAGLWQPIVEPLPSPSGHALQSHWAGVPVDRPLLRMDPITGQIAPSMSVGDPDVRRPPFSRPVLVIAA